MKKRVLAFGLFIGMLLSTACGLSTDDVDTTVDSSKSTEVTHSESMATTTEVTHSESMATTAVASKDSVHVNKINITINPEINIITDDDGNVVEIEYLNDDAKDAYGSLDLIDMPVGEATELIVEAATEHGYLENGKPVTVTLLDSNVDGQAIMGELNDVRDATQKELGNQGFDNCPIQACVEVEVEPEHEHVCDLCLGSLVVVCDGCNGTTYLDGNAWTVCGMCSGEGRTLCTLCEGAGSIACGNCGGSGVDEAEDDGVCFGCHGSGTTPCNRCGDGSGYQVCYDCKGAGRLGGLPCPRCGGTLWTVCYRCKGTGVTE